MGVTRTLEKGALWFRWHHSVRERKSTGMVNLGRYLQKAVKNPAAEGQVSGPRACSEDLARLTGKGAGRNGRALGGHQKLANTRVPQHSLVDQRDVQSAQSNLALECMMGAKSVSDDTTGVGNRRGRGCLIREQSPE